MMEEAKRAMAGTRQSRGERGETRGKGNGAHENGSDCLGKQPTEDGESLPQREAAPTDLLTMPGMSKRRTATLPRLINAPMAKIPTPIIQMVTALMMSMVLTTEIPTLMPTH